MGPAARVNSFGFVTSIATVVCLTPFAAAQWVPPSWQFHRIGLVNSQHTGLGGRQTSTAAAINADSVIIGSSTIYLGASSPRGTSAWVWTPQTSTVRLGFFDSQEHGGTQLSEAEGVSPTGTLVVGHSRRSRGSLANGFSAWIWSPELGTTRLGFLDAEHTGLNEYRASGASFVNSAGRVVGSSVRFIAGVEAGSTAWTWTHAEGYTRTGLFDSAHTRADGWQSSVNVQLSESGAAIGTSSRFLGSANAGTSAWVWSPGGAQFHLGYLDAEHTRANGERVSNPIAVNDAGRVVGHSRRYLGQSQGGSSAWTWTADGGHATIGLLDADHVRSDGFQSSFSTALNQAGQVIGHSLRYAEGGGQSAWRWTNGQTQRLGLLDAEHTFSNGAQISAPIAINQKGNVTGTSARTNGGTATQYTSAWVTDSSGVAHRTGLFDAAHTSSAGHQWSTPELITESAVVGRSVRYSVPSYPSITSWYYDLDSKITTPLIFSVSFEGSAWTRVSALTESGWVVGTFFDYDQEPLGIERGFLWSLPNGFTDLGSLIEDGLTPVGWDVLAGTVGAADLQTIVGNIELSGGLVRGSYALTVPAPTSAALISFLVVFAQRRRRHTSTHREPCSNTMLP